MSMEIEVVTIPVVELQNIISNAVEKAISKAKIGPVTDRRMKLSEAAKIMGLSANPAKDELLKADILTQRNGQNMVWKSDLEKHLGRAVE